MKTIKKFDISKCKDPKDITFTNQELVITPLSEIKHPWQRERAQKAQQIYNDFLESLKNDLTWNERFDEHQKAIREKIRNNSN